MRQIRYSNAYSAFISRGNTKNILICEMLFVAICLRSVWPPYKPWKHCSIVLEKSQTGHSRMSIMAGINCMKQRGLGMQWNESKLTKIICYFIPFFRVLAVLVGLDVRIGLTVNEFPKCSEKTGSKWLSAFLFAKLMSQSHRWIINLKNKLCEFIAISHREPSSFHVFSEVNYISGIISESVFGHAI